MATFQLTAEVVANVIQQASDEGKLPIQDQADLLDWLNACLATHSTPVAIKPTRSSKTARVPGTADSEGGDSCCAYEHSSFVEIDEAEEERWMKEHNKTRPRCRARVWQSKRGGRCQHEVCESADGTTTHFCKQHGKALKSAKHCPKCSKWKGEEVTHFATWECMGRVDQARNPLHGFLYTTDAELEEIQRLKGIKTTRKKPTKSTVADKDTTGKKTDKTDKTDKTVKKKTPVMMESLQSDGESEEDTTAPAPSAENNSDHEDNLSNSESDSDDDSEDSRLQMVNGMVDGKILLVHLDDDLFYTASTMDTYTISGEPRDEPLEIKYRDEDTGDLVHRATLETDGTVSWIPVE